jgi:hypothetical protein
VTPLVDRRRVRSGGVGSDVSSRVSALEGPPDQLPVWPDGELLDEEPAGVSERKRGPSNGCDRG